MVARRASGTNDMKLKKGFTLIELLVVMAVIALIVSIVAPRYLDRVDAARETVLRQDLRGLRTSIDQFYRDKGIYPKTLDDLVVYRYIRSIPPDPITGRTDTWKPIYHQDANNGVVDVRSGANGRANDGSEYANW